MTVYYSPGCALLLYKPDLAEKILETLKRKYPDIGMHTVCCHHEPGLPEGSVIINTCPGCDRRFSTLYKGIKTISLWEVMTDIPDFSFPDYGGSRMAVLDACPVRGAEHVHDAVRKVLAQMNISVSEPEHTRASSRCCGDSFYGRIPVNEVLAQMEKRAGEMPEEEVAVYCVSCVKSMKNGGRTPRYLPDLLFGESTEAGDCDPDRWHADVDAFIEAH